MTPPEPLTGVRPPASTKERKRPAWAHRVQRVQREQRESHHDDGWLMAVELVTATFTWGGIGYLVDRFWLETYPVFMSIGFVVGFFAGVYLLWLKTSQPAAAPKADAHDEGGGDVGA